jgi:uncharacterized glyoxalase superfamily protein PhnB
MTMSVPRGGSTIVPCLLYRDAPAMIEWLCDVFDFERHAVYANGDGTIGHAELTLGAGMVMVSSTPRPDDTSTWARLVRTPADMDGAETQSPALCVSDPDGAYARVKSRGGEIVLDIEDKSYGGRGFTCRDPEGHLWSVGSYDPWKSPQSGIES